MAVLQQIRVKFGLAISIIIALALLSFIIDFNTLDSALNAMSSKNDVGEINGKSVSYTDFSADVERMSKINEIITGSSSTSEEQSEQIRNAAWQENVYKYLFFKKAKAAGVAVGKDEMLALTTGDMISPIIAQDPLFADENGNFSKERLVQIVQNINADNTGNLRLYWDYVQNAVYSQQLFSKYATLFSASNLVNALSVKNAIENNNTTADVEFVSVPLNPYQQDSTITVSNSELKEYYNAHKKFFKQKASRDIEYVVFEVKPSEDDINAVADEFAEQMEEFASTSNLKAFLLKNSDRHYSEYWYKAGELKSVNADVEKFVSENNSGTSAVYRNGNTFYAARVMATAQVPDSVYVKHILLQGASDEKVDSVLNALKGESFANVAAQYSADQRSAEDGQLGSIGWMTQNYMIPGFESVFTAETGKPYIVKTQYGTHVVLVSKKTAANTKKQVAVFQKEVLPSNATTTAEYAKANDFAVAAAGGYAAYKAAADTQGVYSHTLPRVVESNTSYGAVSNAKEVTRWIFDNKKGKVSDVIEVNNQYFFVATIKDIHEEGYATLDEVKEQIRPILYGEKLSAKKAAEVKEQIAGLDDLQAIAEKLGTTVSTQEDLTFSTAMSSRSLDPKFIGAVAAAPVGKVSEPLAGTVAVYVFKVTGRDTGAFYTEADAKNANANAAAYYNQTIIPVMMDDAEVKDNRARFF
ncbi:MAG: SurA N-terminal domain-containing protein [Bacteroidales bacterium]|nr:SurA N-terminal domain-containing protein [Bacteroidales bacterium]